MQKQIKFIRQTMFTGRNGYFKCSGIDFLGLDYDDNVMIAPLTSRGEIGRCDITFPKEQGREIANAILRTCGLPIIPPRMSFEDAVIKVGGQFFSDDSEYTYFDYYKALKKETINNPHELACNVSMDNDNFVSMWQPMENFTVADTLNLIDGQLLDMGYAGEIELLNAEIKG